MAALAAVVVCLVILLMVLHAWDSAYGAATDIVGEHGSKYVPHVEVGQG